MIKKEGPVEEIDFEAGSLLGNTNQAFSDYIFALLGGDVGEKELGKVWQVFFLASLEELEDRRVGGEERGGSNNATIQKHKKCNQLNQN